MNLRNNLLQRRLLSGSVPDLPCADDAPTSNLIQTTIGLYLKHEPL